MFTLHDLASRIGDGLAEQTELDVKHHAYIVFALEGLLASFYSIFFTAVVSFILGNINQVMLLLLFTGTLRIFTGGAHASTPTRCALYTTAVFNGAGFLLRFIGPLPLWWILLFLFLGTLVAFFAPVESSGKPLGKKRKIVLKRITFAVLVLDAVLFSILSWSRPFILISMGIVLILMLIEKRKGGVNVEEDHS